MKFLRTYSVRSSEIDPFYRLKDFYIGFYFQEAFAEYAASKELAAYDVAKLGLTWLTTDVRIDFSGKMPLWRDRVEMAVWLWKAGGVRICMNFSATANGAEIARGCGVNLIADAKSRKPVRAAEFAARFVQCEEPVFEDETFGKIVPIEEGETTETSQVVRFDDLDFNRHLNSVKYVPRALEAVPIEYRLAHPLKSYRIKYERETFFNDHVKSSAVRAGNEIYHALTRPSDGARLCSVRTLWK